MSKYYEKGSKTQSILNLILITKKRKIMNKITKLFLVILSASSLTLSAIAGELSVTGGATATYKIGGADKNAGKGIGVSNELDFNASGELDNGFTWTWQAQLDGATATNDDTKLVVGTPYGDLGFYVSEGDISTKFKYDIGAMGPGSDYTGPSTIEHGVTMNSYNNMGYATPSGLLPYGISAKVSYAPNLSSAEGSSAKADGAVATKALGTDAVAYAIHATPIDGLKVGADYAVLSGGTDVNYHAESASAYAKYTQGPLSVGFARSGYQPSEDKGVAAGTAGGSTYDTNMYGVQYAVNDALSLSLSQEKATQNGGSALSGASAATAGTDVNMKITHIQAAYVVGGATIGLAIADADNADYTEDREEKTTTLSIAMAF
tara:strand:+ start:4045 stop:5175 length:1131 start_codon:yes stop_codon:yes gene_type:complete